MRWKEDILKLTPYKPGKSIAQVEKEFGLHRIVKLASNENPYGCSKQVVEKLKQYDASIALYPDGYATEIRKELAKFLGILENQLMFGAGSDENIQIITRALLGPGWNTVMATPTFSQYKHNAIIEGAEVREIPLINGMHDLDGMLSAIDERTNIVWLCSPNNPTGTYINQQDLLHFLNRVPEETLVVLDEAYYEYVVADDYYDSVDLIRHYQNLIVLRTFSKIYGLASQRIGYAFSNEKIMSILEPVRQPFNTNTLAHLTAMTALKDQGFIELCKKRNRQGLEKYYLFCEEYGLSYMKSQGNFILIDFGIDGDDVFQYFLEKGYIVRSGKALGFPTAVRITIGSDEENEGLLNVIKAFIREPLVKAALAK